MAHQINAVSDIAEHVKKRRKSLGLTQVELAAIAGCGNRFIVDLERGKPTIQLGKALYVMKMLGLRVSLESLS